MATMAARFRPRARRAMVFAALLSTVCGAARATDGYFDASWPPGIGGGKLTLTPGLAYNTATALAFQNDGKVLLAVATSDSSSDFSQYVACVVRLLPDGSYDYSFGPAHNGRACLNQFAGVPALPTIAGQHALRVQPDSKIVFGGQMYDDVGNSHVSGFIARLNADGTLDSSAAGGAGYVKFQFGSAAGAYLSSVSGLLVQADGKIVAAGFGCGTAAASCNQDFAAARFTSNLTFDPTFAGGGRTLIAFDLGGNQNDQANDLALQADGKIVLAGSANTATSSELALVRLGSNGAVDAAFGNQGRFHLGVDGYAQAFALTLDANGRIVTTGRAAAPSDASIELLMATRVLADGSAVDATFGGAANGYGSTPAGTALIGFADICGSASDYLDGAFATSIQSDGRIVLVGQANVGDGSNFYQYFTLARLLPDHGTLDSTFGAGGRSCGTFGATGDVSGAAAGGFAAGNHLMVTGYDQANSSATSGAAGLARITIDLVFWGGFEAPTDTSNR